MISVNKVHLVGNMTKDPEIKTTANGKMARFSLATNRRYRDRETNEMKDATQFHDVVVFNEHYVGLIEGYCRKGTQVLVEGQLEHRTYDDKDGNRRYITEVVLRAYASDFQLGNRPSGEQGNSDNQSNNNNNNNNQSNNQSGGGYQNNRDDDYDDEVPF